MPINLKNIDLNLLVIFEAIYATANISRAAERLGMSQPAVSHSLARLREQLDDQLFVRAQNGVQPTIKARELIGPAREALGVIKRHFDDRSEIDLATYKRIFRVIMADPLEPIVMPPIIRTLMSQAPHIQIECIQASGQFSEGIKNGTIDIACFSFPVDTTDMVVEAMCPFDLVLVSRRGHPAIKPPLDFETFQGLTHIALGRELRGLTNVDRSLIAHSMPRKVAYMAAKIWSIPSLVERTDIVAMLPRSFVREIEHNFELDVHELPIEMPEQYAYMMWHANNNLDPGHIWLRQSMMQAVRSNISPAGGLRDG